MRLEGDGKWAVGGIGYKGYILTPGRSVPVLMELVRDFLRRGARGALLGQAYTEVEPSSTGSMRVLHTESDGKRWILVLQAQGHA